MASPRLTDTNRSPRLGFNYAQQLREFPLVSLSPHKEWRSRRPDSGRAEHFVTVFSKKSSRGLANARRRSRDEHDTLIRHMKS